MMKFTLTTESKEGSSWIKVEDVDIKDLDSKSKIYDPGDKSQVIKFIKDATKVDLGSAARRLASENGIDYVFHETQITYPDKFTMSEVNVNARTVKINFDVQFDGQSYQIQVDTNVDESSHTIIDNSQYSNLINAINTKTNGDFEKYHKCLDVENQNGLNFDFVSFEEHGTNVITNWVILKTSENFSSLEGMLEATIKSEAALAAIDQSSVIQPRQPRSL